MKSQMPLSQFSEPQAVLILLGFLRVITTGLLLGFCIIIELFEITALQALIDWQLLLIIGIAILSLSLGTYFFKHKHLTQNHLTIILLADIISWYGLIYASGGAINPAISYLLVLLCIAALSLSIKKSIFIAIITVFLYAAMMKSQPQQHHGHMLDWHLWGMRLLFLMNAFIMLIVITLLSRALKEKDKAITEYREETARNEKLVSIGTMAANIAHELGTPLTTIGLLADDIDDDVKKSIQQQIERCKKALQQLKGTAQNLHAAQQISSSQLVERWVHESLLLHPEAKIEWSDSLEQCLTITPLFEQAVLAVFNNAIHAAQQNTHIHIFKNAEKVIIDIQHDGENISDALLKTLGRQVVDSDKDGLGLGYYLANASIERLGGTIQISNQITGVLTRIEFPINLMIESA
jgi:two-component system sensor histidine kinase RegB